jgi:hypothetical protein
MCRREKRVSEVSEEGERLVEQVESFTELGSTITCDGRSTSDLNRRIAQAKTEFMAKRSLLCSRITIPEIEDSN